MTPAEFYDVYNIKPAEMLTGETDLPPRLDTTLS